MNLWTNVRETLISTAAESHDTIFAAMRTRALGPLLIAREAERDGARIEWLSRYMFVARVEDVDILFHDSRSLDTTVAATFSGRKDLTRVLLQRSGIPVAPGGVAKSLAKVSAMQKRLNAPLVIKPKTGTKGYGISVGVQTPTELKRAFRRANKASAGGLVERQMSGVPRAGGRWRSGGCPGQGCGPCGGRWAFHHRRAHRGQECPARQEPPSLHTLDQGAQAYPHQPRAAAARRRKRAAGRPEGLSPPGSQFLCGRGDAGCHRSTARIRQ